ncbi:MAG: DUF434 domain-containing protein [Spirochaetales bacterium]
MSGTFPDNFPEAARDYRMLLDKGYPVEASIRLVGDRYRLDKAGRTILFRGILPERLSRENLKRRAASLIPGSRIALDGYNVLFTMTNYLRGHPLFIATDGFLRDAGGAHGRVTDTSQFLSAIDECCASLKRLAVSHVEIYLDAPISRSAEHAQAARLALTAHHIPGNVIMVPSADGFVADWDGDAVASSDSVVIAKSHSPVFDLARQTLETRYDVDFPDLAAFFKPREPAL